MIETYIVIVLLLLAAELMYFKVADYFNVIDKPNERSSHSTIVYRGGGIIFTLSMILWLLLMIVQGNEVLCYLPFVGGLFIIAGISFLDDIRSLTYSMRLVTQFICMGFAVWSMIRESEFLTLEWYWLIAICFAAQVVLVGATNIINFMDGINGITAGYAIAVLLPLLLVNDMVGFIEQSYLEVAIIGVSVFFLFNFRPKGKAKCFAGDVGSISIAFIMLFAIGKLIVQTRDIAWLIFLIVYGVDGCLTIIHRIMLHENLREAHRKHAYQLMCNELRIGHVKISLLYMVVQLVISLVMIYLIPNTVLAHWIFLIAVASVMAVVYVWFIRKYYHLHEEYLLSLKK